MFTATAVAVAGTLQVLTITNVRLVPPESGGPPSGPTGLRVSMMRQGKTVKKLIPCGGFVGVGVLLGVLVGDVTAEVARAHVNAGGGDLGLEQIRSGVRARTATAEIGERAVDIDRSRRKRSTVDRQWLTHGRAIRTAVARRGRHEDTCRLGVVNDRLQL